MTSSCPVRRRLLEAFALATRVYAESAVCLATSVESGIDHTALCDQTIEAQGRTEVAFRTSEATSLRLAALRFLLLAADAFAFAHRGQRAVANQESTE
jgi:hypothetical protein